jgi:hypothetical protein
MHAGYDSVLWVMHMYSGNRQWHWCHSGRTGGRGATPAWRGHITACQPVDVWSRALCACRLQPEDRGKRADMAAQGAVMPMCVDPLIWCRCTLQLLSGCHPQDSPGRLTLLM